MEQKGPPRSGSNPFAASRRLFVILVILGFGLRIGYGVVRYRNNLSNLKGDAFINMWNHDALYHVLIAKALLSGKGYIVDDSPLPPERHIPNAGQEALFKAPLYEFFLAGVFAVSGFSFKLFFPLQALLGGFLSGFLGLIALQAFRQISVARFAGIAAAIHPILVDSASQPYNENLFFFFFIVSIWLFFFWLETQKARWAILCGIGIGLCMLTRENGSLLLVSMAALVLLALPRTLKTWIGFGAITFATIAVVAPWTLRNYVRFGILVPVASIVGVDFTAGNNECVATEGAFVPYWAEGPCAAVVEQRRALLAATESESRIPEAVRRDRVSQRIAVQFLLNHPGAYAKLAFRRLWTTLLPYDPRGNQRFLERVILSLYWALVFPAGIIGLIVGLKRPDPKRILLGLLIVLNLLAIAALLYWSDLRFRVGIDLLLACFAGGAYADVLWTKPSSRFEKVEMA